MDPIDIAFLKKHLVRFEEDLEKGLANDLREIKALLWEVLQELKKLNLQ